MSNPVARERPTKRRGVWGRLRQRASEADSPLPLSAKQNLETIAEVEKRFLNKRSRIERAGDAIARFFGSFIFVVAHLTFLTGWFVVNTGCTSFKVFDPYPFPFLCLLLAIEFILLTTFVLMNQKRLVRQAEHWSHLDLQLSILTEQEVTKSLQMLRHLCQRLGVEEAIDQESHELAQPTPVGAFVEEVERALNQEETKTAAGRSAKAGSAEKEAKSKGVKEDI